jgi:MFS family permease
VAAPFVAIIVLQLIDAAAIRPLGASARRRAITGKRNPFRDLGDGVRYVFTDRTLLSLFLILFFASLITYPYLQLLPVFAEDVLGAGSAGYGAIFAMAGVGSIIGLLVLAQLNPSRGRGKLMFAGFSSHLVGVAIFSQVDHLVVAMVVLMFGGIGFGMAMALYVTLFQLHVRDDMRGRALSVANMANQFLTIGALPMGLTVYWLGIQDGVLVHVLVTGAVFVAIGVLRPEWRRV